MLEISNYKHSNQDKIQEERRVPEEMVDLYQGMMSGDGLTEATVLQSQIEWSYFLELKSCREKWIIERQVRLVTNRIR